MIINYSKTYIKEVLKEVKTIAVVGASGNHDRGSYKVKIIPWKPLMYNYNKYIYDSIWTQ